MSGAGSYASIAREIQLTPKVDSKSGSWHRATVHCLPPLSPPLLLEQAVEHVCPGMRSSRRTQEADPELEAKVLSNQSVPYTTNHLMPSTH